jgi:hypothetical protein
MPAGVTKRLSEDKDRTEAELRAALGAFEAVHAETLRQLDRTDAALDAALAYFAAKDARRTDEAT